MCRAAARAVAKSGGDARKAAADFAVITDEARTKAREILGAVAKGDKPV